MTALLICATALAQDPAAPATPAEPSAVAAEPAPPVYTPSLEPICHKAAACSNYETYQECTTPSCDFMTDETLVARNVCTKEGFTAWCVKPKEPPRSTSGACICDSGSPAGGWLGGVALLFVAARKRRA